MQTVLEGSIKNNLSSKINDWIKPSYARYRSMNTGNEAYNSNTRKHLKQT